jgi:hypothetical protein
MISSDVQQSTLQTFLEVTKTAVESQAQAIQGEDEVNLVPCNIQIAQNSLYHLEGTKEVEIQDFASGAQLEQFLNAAGDTVDQDEWIPSHGMIDKTWAERNALEEGM